MVSGSRGGQPMKAGIGFAVLAVFLGYGHVAFAQQGDANAGKAVYTKSCATCHGADGAANQAIAKMLKVEIPHLGSAEVQAKSDADLKKVVTDGYEKMKPVKGLTDKDVTNVVAYVRTLKKA
jgi:mono/diheme cytochrome c family protein